MTTTAIAPEVFVKMIINEWDLRNDRLMKVVDNLSEEELMAETAPGRNRGIYLFGHLIGVMDSMIPVLGWGEALHPELTDVFVKSPDKSGKDMPTVSQLRSYWKEVHAFVASHILAMKPEDWFQRHTLVSEADFAKEPHRNKLNILVSRSNHASYHSGQMVYLSKKK